jgi:anti-sigma B factor antagonist
MQGIKITDNRVGAKRDIVLLTVSGYVDTTTCHELAKVIQDLVAQKQYLLIADLRGVNYISSAGIRVILKAQKSLKQRDGQFLMSNLQPQVKKVFEIINALPMMKIYSNTQELDRYLDAIQRKMTGEDDE